MKKIFCTIAALLLVMSFVGCEEKSDMEKAQDSVKNAWQDTKDAVNEATK